MAKNPTRLELDVANTRLTDALDAVADLIVDKAVLEKKAVRLEEEVTMLRAHEKVLMAASDPTDLLTISSLRTEISILKEKTGRRGDAGMIQLVNRLEREKKALTVENRELKSKLDGMAV